MLAIDWNRVAPPTLIVFGLGLLGLVLRPVLAIAVHWLFLWERGRATDSVMEALSTKDGKVRFKSLVEDLFEDEMAERAATLEDAVKVASANADALRQLDFTTKALAMSQKEIESSVRDVPRVINAFEGLQGALTDIAEEMKKVRDFMSRSDEREKVREREERRRQDTSPNPGRRTEDR